MRAGTVEKRYWVWLSSIKHIRARQFYALIARYGSAEAVFYEKSLAKAGILTPAQSKAVLDAQNEGCIDALRETLYCLQARAVTRLDDAYPPLLKEIFDPPPTLFVRGKREISFSQVIGMVGTRKCTRAGEEAVRQIAEGISRAGVTVVSGMARGIDSAAHEGALSGGADTVAVLGCGLDIIYPPENKALYHRILEQGCVVSEYVPGTPPASLHFPARNRIISGMSNGVIMGEAPARSGASITIDLALSEGREVFAIPGNILSPQSEAPNELIKNGAHVVTGAEDILYTMGWEVDANAVMGEPDALPMPDLNLQELAVVRYLLRGEAPYGELADNTDLSAADLNTVLTMLELRGIMKQLPGKRYMLSPGLEKKLATLG